MKQYLLDTNICAFILRDKYNIGQHLLEVGIDNCHISVITYIELYYGAINSKNVDKNLRQVEGLAQSIDVIPIDEVVHDYAVEKVKLRRSGAPIDDFDLLIGATVLTYGMTLVTENIKHLGKIEKLQIENWVER